MKHSSFLKPFLGIAFAFIALLNADPALACKCAVAFPPPPFGTSAGVPTMKEPTEAAPDDAQVIFEGRVERLEVNEGPMSWMGEVDSTEQGIFTVVTLRVSAGYRGFDQKLATVFTGLGGGDCGFEFRVGDEYLVYADKNPDGSLHTDICMGTDLLEKEGRVRRRLRGEPPTAEDLLDANTYDQRVESQWTGEICGKVTVPGGGAVQDGNLQIWPTNRVLLMPLIGKFGMASDEGEIKADGSYCLGTIDPGKYWVAADAGPYCGESSSRFEGFFSSGASIDQATPVEVKGGARTTGIDFVLHPVTSVDVRVRVLGLDGKPPRLEGLVAGLANQDGNWISRQWLFPEQVHSDGKVEFSCVTPGHYRIYFFSDSGLIHGVDREITVSGQDMEVEMVLPPEKKN